MWVGQGRARMAGPCWEDFLLCYSLNVAKSNHGARPHEAALCTGVTPSKPSSCQPHPEARTLPSLNTCTPPTLKEKAEVSAQDAGNVPIPAAKSIQFS